MRFHTLESALRMKCACTLLNLPWRWKDNASERRFETPVKDR